MRTMPPNISSARHGALTIAAVALAAAALVTACSASTGTSSTSPTSTLSTGPGSPTTGTPSATAPTAVAVPSSASASPSPSVYLPTPSGTWTPSSRKGAKGPTAPVAVPTSSARITAPVSFDTRVTVKLVTVRAITVKARTPGEQSGPAVLVVVSVQNRSTDPVDVSSAVVNLSAGKGVLGIGTTAGNPSPLTGTVAAGRSATGSYVFMLSPAKGRQVTVSVNYSASEPVAVFTGKTA